MTRIRDYHPRPSSDIYYLKTRISLCHNSNRRKLFVSFPAYKLSCPNPIYVEKSTNYPFLPKSRLRSLHACELHYTRRINDPHVCVKTALRSYGYVSSPIPRSSPHDCIDSQRFRIGASVVHVWVKNPRVISTFAKATSRYRDATPK